MAEQEACASAVTEALAASGQPAVELDARGESLLLPLLQGLLGSGPRLAGLGAAGADVVADVRRALGRLRAALAPPAPHPQAAALLALAARLEDELRAADRLDGCRRRSRRRPRHTRHTVGVTHEELEQARRLVDRDQLLPAPQDRDLATGSSDASSLLSGEPTPERRPSIDDPKYHDEVYYDAPPPREPEPVPPVPVPAPAPAPQQMPPPQRLDNNTEYEVTERPIANGLQAPVEELQPMVNGQPALTNGYAVERRAPGPRRPDFFRHSIADAAPPTQQVLPRMDRRPSEKSGIAAIADKFNAQIEKENAPPPARRAPPPRVAAPPAPRREEIRAPLYKPLPPTYNFAAPPAEEPSKPLPRFSANKKNRMKRANTIDIGRPLGGYRADDSDEEARRGAAPPPFRPQTDNDRKFVAFMRRNEQNQQVNGFANWSNRFGNIKNTFESREREESVTASVRGAGLSPLRLPRRAPLPSRSPPVEAVKPPWTSERRPAPRPPPSNPPEAARPQPPQYPPVPHSPTRPTVVKPFAAKPVPVNQFSHAPMSAFKPPKKIVSPTSAPTSIVWSPPPGSASERGPAFLSAPRRTANLAARFEADGPPRGVLSPTSSRPPVLPSPPAAPVSVRALPPHRDLAAPELVKKLAPPRPEYDPPPPAYQYDPPPAYYPPPSPVEVAPPTYHQQQPAYPGPPQSELPQQKYVPQQNSYSTPPRSYTPTQQPYASMQQPYVPQQQQPYVPPQRTVTPPPPSYAPPRQTPPPSAQSYRPPPRELDEPKIDAQKLQIEFYEKQVREQARRSAERKPTGPPPAYTVTDYTPANLVSTFVPLQQTPDIEKARAHKVDYLPDVVQNEAPPSPAAPEETTTEHDRVETRVMRGPVRGVATTTAGVRTRHDPRPRDLRGALDRCTARRQVPVPAPAQALAPARPGTSPRSPLHASRDSLESQSASAGSSPLSKSGSWHQLAPSAGPRQVSRAKSMHLLAAPKLYEGVISREELGDKRRTVEAYFGGQVGSARSSHAGAVRARAARSSAGGNFALGRSRTMPAVSELQFLDETNADDAFEDLVSGLA